MAGPHRTLPESARRITVSLEAQVARQVDSAWPALSYVNRSAMIEEALRQFLSRNREKLIAASA